MRYRLILVLSLICIDVTLSNAQSIDKISSQCPRAIGGVASVIAARSGDIEYTPCSTKSNIFVGPTIYSGGNWLWLGGSSNFTVDTLGTVSLGDISGAGTGTKLIIDDNNALIDIYTGGNTARIGEIGAGQNFYVNGGTWGFTDATPTAANIDLSQTGNILLYRTITAIGTTGNQTINKTAGTINIAGTAGSVVLTNSLITANSLIFTTIRTADTTCTNVKSTVAGSGSATITMNANCTAATSIGFMVTN